MKVHKLVPKDPERCALFGDECSEQAPTYKSTWQSRHGTRRIVAFVCTEHALRAGPTCSVERLET